MAGGFLWYLKRALLLFCSVIFVLMILSQYWDFVNERTGSTLSLKMMDEIAFPAVTVCSQYYDLGKAWKELNFPINPFGKPIVGYRSNPLFFYDALDRFGLPVLPNIWRFYMTIDKVVMATSADRRFCTVGGVFCSPPKYLVFAESPFFNYVKEEFELEVPAGKWMTKLVSDSQYGALRMCHTLIPNVTADFSSLEGRQMSISWMVEFAHNVTHWRVYVHDRHEHFLPSTYAIETMPSVVFQKNQGQRNVMLKPNLFKKPEPSDKHPCIKDPAYSENLCNIQHGWDKKIKIMEDYYGDRFKCQIPGILSGTAKRRPVCDNYWNLDDGTLGQYNLTKDDFHNKSIPVLGLPGVGSFLPSSTCKPRCSQMRYTLEEQVVTGEGEVRVYDLNLYFDSPMVQVWDEYRLDSPMDFVVGIGGSVGLILGMSILSMLNSILDVAERVGKKIIRGKSHG